MRYLISIAAFLCSMVMLGQNGYGDYDPGDNPPDPEVPKVKSRVTLKVEPEKAGYVSDKWIAAYAGEDVYVSTSRRKSNFTFRGWRNSKGETVNINYSFYYTMPEGGDVLTAVYEYDPTSPDNPDGRPDYKFTVSAEPSRAGSFNFSTDKVYKYKEGEGVEVRAYRNSNYQLVGWRVNGGEIVVQDTLNPQRYRFNMPAEHVNLTAVYRYEPSSPANPGSNFWNSATGELIMDDFQPGELNWRAEEKVNGKTDQVGQITVCGKINDGDWSLRGTFSNCTYMDYSRTSGSNYIPSWSFESAQNLTTVLLPECLTRINDCAFANCENLSSVTCYALEPPYLESNVFAGIAEGAVLYVPVAAVDTYMENEQWSQYFGTILPISEQVSSVTINLPESCMQRVSNDLWETKPEYRNMSLELVNTATGQRHMYVVTNQTKYVYRGLIKNSYFTATLRNLQGKELGTIPSIHLGNEPEEVEFDKVEPLYTARVKVLTLEGKDVTAEVQAVQWMDDKDNYLSRVDSIIGQLAETPLKCMVTLSQALGMQYRLPEVKEYTVDPADLTLVVNLEAIPKVKVSGRVESTTDGALKGAAVAFLQTLNGRYSKTTIAKTDENGYYEAEIFDDPTRVAVSMDDYVSNESLAFDSFDEASVTLETIALKPVSGAAITTSFTFTPSVKAGEKPEVQEYNGASVRFSLYNKTTGQDIEEFSVQNSKIWVPGVNEGDVIEITAASANDMFKPVKATVTIDGDSRGEATFNITGLGGIFVSRTNSQNDADVCILYDANDKIIKSYSLPDEGLTIEELRDGSYWIVVMGVNEMFNAVPTTKQLDEMQLKDKKGDLLYKKTLVSVKSGSITSYKFANIPLLDVSTFSYTGDNTLVEVNKSQVVAGNYLVLKASVDFKANVEVSVVQLIINLPDGCNVNENSVMLGKDFVEFKRTSANSIIIDMNDCSQAARLCFIPTVNGEQQATASVQYKLKSMSKPITQPIGSANFTVKGLSLTVPSSTFRAEIPVCGTAMSKSAVTIYDNGVMVGTATALANGYWSAMCALTSTGYLEKHTITATSEKDGIKVQSDAAICTYDPLALKVDKVTMYNTAHPATSLNLCEYVTVFDFLNPRQPETYWYWPSYPEFTFKVEFTKNDPSLINTVNLIVHTTSGKDVIIPAKYNERKNSWIANKNFDSQALPLSVSVQYNVNGSDLNEDATYEAILGEMLGDFTVEKEGDGLRNNIVKDGDGNVVGEFTDEVVDDDKAQQIADELKGAGYTTDVDDEKTGGKVLFNENDSTFVYLVPDAPEGEGRKWWILRIKVTTTYDKELVDATDIIGSEWYKHIELLSECEEVDIDITYRETLRRLIYKVTKTWMYKSVLESYEDDELVSKFINIICVITHRTSTEYQREIQECVSIVSIPVPCGPAPNPNIDPFPGPGAPHVMDPSGFVYEAVESNRIEGVKATAYFREASETPWGEIKYDVVLWDAEEYAQENPLYTDANGMYAWDVPQGEWQVKFEKDGYETTYSDWLPVPPPQMDINIAMQQIVQPQVLSAAAYVETPTAEEIVASSRKRVEGAAGEDDDDEDQQAGVSDKTVVEIMFDKYMDASTLTSENIYVLDGESKVDGEIVLPDAEESNGMMLARKVRFEIADDADISSKSLVIHVDKAVESYAGKQMLDDFSQPFAIKQKIRGIDVPKQLSIEEGGNTSLLVTVTPTEPAQNKLLTVRSSSLQFCPIGADSDDPEAAASVDKVYECRLDENGQARIMVYGELTGSAELTFSVEDTELQGKTKVVVVDKDMLVKPNAPTSNLGTYNEVYRGTAVKLASANENEKVYYTIGADSNPLDASSRIEYKNPIAVNDDNMEIKAVVVNTKTGLESEASTFTYVIRKIHGDVTLVKDWNWVSHYADENVSASVMFKDAKRVMSQTQELIYDDYFDELIGNLSTVSPSEGIKVKYDTDEYALPLDGREAVNPAQADIVLYEGWNWIGYPVSGAQPLNDALAKHEAMEGDYLQGQSGVATYENGSWSGTLEELKPGHAYLYKSGANTSFIYDDSKVGYAHLLNAPSVKRKARWTAVDYHKYPSQMSIIADIEGEENADYTVGAFDAQGECRGVGKVVNGRIFMSVYGEGKPEEITFLACYNPTEIVYVLNDPMTFKADVVGSMSAPHAFRLGGEDPTGIGTVSADGTSKLDGKVYDLSGRAVEGTLKRGAYIVNGKKVIITK